MPSSVDASSQEEHPRALLTEVELEATSIVANRQMNRERELRGGNGYSRDLGFDPIEQLSSYPHARWLDMCCGTGRAIFQAKQELGDRVDIVGVDLVDYFWPGAVESRVRFVVSPARSFVDPDKFDLITCVHGLHYIGDKLGALIHLRSLLREGGRLIGHLDLDHIVIDGRSNRRSTAKLLRDAGFQWHARRHLIEAGAVETTERDTVYESAQLARFLGARLAGPNYTGQAAVESVYASTRSPLPSR